MVFPIAQRSEADGKNHIGLSVGLNEGIWTELGTDFGGNHVGFDAVKVV